MRTMIKGISVKLKVQTQTGVDGFGRPTYWGYWELVDNVLVGERHLMML